MTERLTLIDQPDYGVSNEEVSPGGGRDQD